jgi:hypothetical protein
MATPIPLLLFTPSEGYPYSRHNTFQNLLEAGKVLGFEVTIKQHIDGYATSTYVKVALPDGTDGVDWLEGTDAILAAESRVPGLGTACFALLNDLWNTVCPREVFQAWEPHNPESDESVCYAHVFLTAYGFVVGAFEAEHAFTDEANVLDVLDELAETEPEEHDEVLANWDVGQIAALGFMKPGAQSAHEQLPEWDKLANNPNHGLGPDGQSLAVRRVQTVFEDWQRAYPIWRAKGFDLAMPLVRSA